MVALTVELAWAGEFKSDRSASGSGLLEQRTLGVFQTSKLQREP